MKKSMKTVIALTLFGAFFAGGILWAELDMKKDIRLQQIISENSIDYNKLDEYKYQISNEEKDIKEVYNELIAKYGKGNQYTTVDFYSGTINAVETENNLTTITYITKSEDKLKSEISSKELSSNDLINKKIQVIEVFSVLDNAKMIHYLQKIS